VSYIVLDKSLRPDVLYHKRSIFVKAKYKRKGKSEPCPVKHGSDWGAADKIYPPENITLAAASPFVDRVRGSTKG
jgi:hypothetical protein